MKTLKVSLLSGAYINAGDFLIVDRTKKLLKTIYPECEIIEYKRNEKLDKYLPEINQTDALVIAGGPAYMIDMYPNVLPLVDDLDKITTKIIAIGLGWYGKKTTDKFLYDYKFTHKTKELLDRIVKDSQYLSCRDWYSVKVLFLNGYNSAILTGCPAWYNIEKIDQTKLNENIDYTFQKICISDPADFINIKESLVLVRFLKQKFPNASLYFVFHRIEKQSKQYVWLINQLRNLNIHIVDITGDEKKFKVYDNCDLHIGYRVHAHIYNLSHRNLSLLIEEDGRGSGVNEALGLPSIRAYHSSRGRFYSHHLVSKILRNISRKIIVRKKYNNKNFETEINNCLEMMKYNEYSQFNTAFYNMKLYYKRMEKYLIDVFKEEKSQ